MNGPEFFRTRMGHTFYEHTLPELVKQVARVADALEALAKREQPIVSNRETRGTDEQGKGDVR